jgi:hypothetical protein
LPEFDVEASIFHKGFFEYLGSLHVFLGQIQIILQKMRIERLLEKGKLKPSIDRFWQRWQHG